MLDVLYLLVMVGFVVVSCLFVIGCDKIIGPDEDVLVDEQLNEPEPEQPKVAA